MTIRKRGDWLSARIDDEILMMSAENGLYLGLRDVAARIWELLDTEHDADRLCAALEREFAVSPETCRAELDVFLDELVRHGAIEIVPRAGA